MGSQSKFLNGVLLSACLALLFGLGLLVGSAVASTGCEARSAPPALVPADSYHVSKASQQDLPPKNKPQRCELGRSSTQPYFLHSEDYRIFSFYANASAPQLHRACAWLLNRWNVVWMKRDSKRSKSLYRAIRRTIKKKGVVFIKVAATHKGLFYLSHSPIPTLKVPKRQRYQWRRPTSRPVRRKPSIRTREL